MNLLPINMSGQSNLNRPAAAIAIAVAGTAAYLALAPTPAKPQQLYLQWQGYTQDDLNAFWFEIGCKTNITDMKWTHIATATGTNRWPIPSGQQQMFFMLLRVVDKRVPENFKIDKSYVTQYYNATLR